MQYGENDGDGVIREVHNFYKCCVIGHDEAEEFTDLRRSLDCTFVVFKLQDGRHSDRSKMR